MGVDLTGHERARVQLLIESDALLLLERKDSISDRLRKVFLTRVQSVLVWRSWPWVLIVAMAMFILLACLLSLIPEVGIYITVILLIIALPFVLFLCYCRQTNIRLNYLDTHCTITTITRPGKVRHFVDKLNLAIENAQRQARSQLQSEGKLPITGADDLAPDALAAEAAADTLLDDLALDQPQ